MQPTFMYSCFITENDDKTQFSFFFLLKEHEDKPILYSF